MPDARARVPANEGSTKNPRSRVGHVVGPESSGLMPTILTVHTCGFTDLFHHSLAVEPDWPDRAVTHA